MEDGTAQFSCGLQSLASKLAPKLAAFTAAIGLALAFGCANSRQKPMTETTEAVRVTQRLRQDLRRAQAAIASLNAQNQALRQELLARATEAPAAPPAVLDVNEAPVTADQFLYSKALESYRKKDAADLSKSKQLLIKGFPDSPFADNAALLEAQLADESGDERRALRLFDEMIARFPTGNKIPAALLARARILRSLRKPGQAQASLRVLRERYPGSPEALAAAREK